VRLTIFIVAYVPNVIRGMMGFGVVAITPKSNGKKAENNTIFHTRMGRKALQDNGRVCSSRAKPV
jgi:hypothetical protein